MPSRPSTSPVRGQSERGEPLTRKADDPSRSPSKNMNDPFVGNLTFFRVYSAP